MFASQRKSGQVVIERGARPLCGLMTCATIPAILSIMDIPRGMTSETITGSIFVDPVDVTGLAGCIDVCAGQHEAGCVVIELRRKPGRCGMACLACCSQLTHMHIILFVA